MDVCDDNDVSGGADMDCSFTDDANVAGIGGGGGGGSIRLIFPSTIPK